MKEVMQIVKEKEEFVTLDESKLKVHFRFFGLSKSSSTSTINDISVQHSCLSINCFVEAMVETIEPVVTEKYDFEYRDKSIAKTPFSFWGYQDFDFSKKLKKKFVQIAFSTGRFLD